MNALHIRVCDRSLEQTIHIDFVNPAYPVLPTSDWAAQSEADYRQESRECTAACAIIAADNEAGAQNDPSLIRKGAHVKRVLPCATYERSEPAAERSIFIAHQLRWIAVDVCCAHLYPNGRGRSDRAHCLSQDSRGFNARAEDLVVIIGSLDAVDSTAHQVDQAGGAVEFTFPFPSGAGVP
jgi:hypothetical protein